LSAVSSGTSAEGEQLVIDYCGEIHRIQVGQSLMFGRRAELCIDENPYLHRVVGRFVHRQGLWWLQNHGSKTTLEVRDRGSSSRVVLAPGQQVAVTYQDFLIGFSAGPTSYEIEVTREGEPAPLDELDDHSGTATIDFGKVPLSAEQHLLLVALAEMRLISGDLVVPTNQALAIRLGWTLTKFNRKLDHLCAKLAREGVRGLRGGPDALATDRREALVEHAITVGLVSDEDLGLLARQTG
jgi:hypothetical protein